MSKDFFDCIFDPACGTNLVSTVFTVIAFAMALVAGFNFLLTGNARSTLYVLLAGAASAGFAALSAYF